jgi:hypothetical protein
MERRGRRSCEEDGEVCICVVNGVYACRLYFSICIVVFNMRRSRYINLS